MHSLVKLDDRTHQNLKVSLEAPIELARRSHLLNLNVQEIGKAVSTFPVFLTRSADSGHWAVSALASFRPGISLFVEEDTWIGTYRPEGLQAYPFCLIRDEENSDSYAVGFEPSDPAFSEYQGEPLFGANGKPSEHLQHITRLLQEDLIQAAQTRQFVGHLESLGLIKAISIKVYYEDGRVQTVQGLHTLDEEKIKQLDANIVEDLNRNGCLTMMHAMLTSLYQLNALIRRQAVLLESDRVKQVKLELAKDALVS